MAEIPVEKRSGIPGWVWVLLALIIVALLAWWLLAEEEEDIETAETGIVAEEEYVAGDEFADLEDEIDMPATATITTLAGLSGIASLVGTDVDLDNVTVSSVPGDMMFYIGEGDQQTLVLFDQTPTPDTPMEGEYDINPGMTIDVEGEVRAADGSLSDGVSADMPAGTEAYIYADSIETDE
ncbi:hypothetical protein B5C34_12950 [Pacificimonas flava]|uniref:Uncharacterized protein n=2 Tax=Pacificimonas TaxID=1960290 RepID=A0A219B7W3_9SPHN|nr:MULTISPECIES: hypothetical protein [Pacificimonas]MBZ6378423.1 hypothetical protein [Pacificimonas aurantium]OWV34274.1 hypothetical protein B5C34_12950 [Pacificimonas flava]